MSVEEAPAGPPTIDDAPTSIAAFLGRARRGPVGQPVDLFGVHEFDRVFGGLWSESTLGEAVRDFFEAGGRHAVVVRLHDGATRGRLEVGGLELEAADEGAWGADLRAEVDHRGLDARLVARLGAPLFNLSVREATPGGLAERFTNLSAAEGERDVAAILERDSALVRVRGAGPRAVPAAGSVDPLSAAEAELRAARAAGPEGTRPPSDPIREARARLRAALGRARRRAGDGIALTAASFAGEAARAGGGGLGALDLVERFDLLCIPPHSAAEDGAGAHLEPELIAAAAACCRRRRAVLIVDPWPEWERGGEPRRSLPDLGEDAGSAAVYFPRVRRADPEDGGKRTSAPCGAVAGVIARTDARHGVWRAAAGDGAALPAGLAPAVTISDARARTLAASGVNCLRPLPDGPTAIWGARTLDEGEWRYMPVRRLTLFIEESLHRGLQWAVFEPNDEPLWAEVRRAIGAFLEDLFRRGGLVGRRPEDAWYVRCDRTTMTQADIDGGRLIAVVGVAPVRPGEFVTLHIGQATAGGDGDP